MSTFDKIVVLILCVIGKQLIVNLVVLDFSDTSFFSTQKHSSNKKFYCTVCLEYKALTPEVCSFDPETSESFDGLKLDQAVPSYTKHHTVFFI